MPLGLHIFSFLAGLVVGYLWGTGFFAGILGRRAG